MSIGTNLLIDSLSSHSDDVPDLELVPPLKQKKKRLSRIKSRLGNSGLMSGRVSTISGSPGPPTCWSCTLLMFLLSFLLALFVLAISVIKLQNQLVELQNTTKSEHERMVSEIEFSSLKSEVTQLKKYCNRPDSIVKTGDRKDKSLEIIDKEEVETRLDGIAKQMHNIQLLINETMQKRIDVLQTTVDSFSLAQSQMNDPNITHDHEIAAELATVRNLTQQSTEKLAESIDIIQQQIINIKANVSECCFSSSHVTPGFIRGEEDIVNQSPPLLPPLNNSQPNANIESSLSNDVTYRTTSLPKVRKRPSINGTKASNETNEN